MTPRSDQAARSKQKIAFLLVANGGTARDAAKTFDTFYRLDGRPFPKTMLYVDTEPVESPFADRSLSIGLTAEHVDALRADPAIHGPVAEEMVRRHPQLLKKESIRNGSRTCRPLTQLAMEVHLAKVIEEVNRTVRELIRSSGANNILPVFFSSTGGGAGSALVPIFGQLFADEGFRALVTEGLPPDLLDLPVAVVTEPFAFALKVKTKQANRILANALAFRIETALLEADEAFQYLFHQGLANEGGAVLDSQAEICKGLGVAVYQLCRNWSYIKARFVDTVDCQKFTDRYRGIDLPERHVPQPHHPSFASPAKERKRYRRISLIRNNGKSSNGHGP